MNKKKTGVAAREMQRASRKHRHAEVMRNRVIFGLACFAVLALIVFVIVKIFSVVNSNKNLPDTSLLTINEDGTILYEEVTDFDEELYSKDELLDYIDELVESFNETYGSDVIKLESVTIKDDKAFVRSVYENADIYSTFTSYPVYVGDVEGAMEAGYAFDSIFCEVADGAEGDTVEFDNPTFFEDYELAIVQENTTVSVPGTIKYISNHSTKLVEGTDNEVLIAQADGNEDATEVVYIIFEKMNK